MPSPRTASVACFAATLLCGQLHAQVELYSLPTPEGQPSQASKVEMEIKGRTASSPGNLPIPLDDTGFADWRFVNPRSPLQVDTGVLLLFINQTPDRIFEVTTRLSLNQASFVESGDLPSTLPLLVYDAFSLSSLPPQDRSRDLSIEEIEGLTKTSKGLNRERIRPDETVESYENRLYEPYMKDPRFGTILKEVLDLEAAIRRLSAAAKREKEARAGLSGLLADTLGAKFELAKAELKNAKAARERAEAEVALLKFGRTTDTEYLSKVRKVLIDEFGARRSWLGERRASTTNPALKLPYGQLFDFFGAAVDALKNQSPEVSLLAPLSRSLPSVRLTDCSVTDAIACSATIQVYQNGTNSFPYEVLLFQADPTGPAKFTLKFFGEEESPAKSTAYLVARGRSDKFGPPRSSASISAVASVGIARDPFIPKNDKSMNCPAFCESKPYEGAQRTHYPGTGRIEVVQTFGDLFDGKVSIGFKEGDLGSDGSLAVKLSQYRFNLYSQPGWTFHYGKYAFSAPSSGIAINESGEGLRLAFRNYGLARLIKRENTGVDDKTAHDHAVWIFDAANLQIPVDFLRTVSVTATYGDDQKEPGKIKFQDQGDIESFSAHKYSTVGGQAGFTAPWSIYGTISAYRSKRTAEEKNAPCGTTLHVCDGKGDVGLLTISRPMTIDDNGKVTRTATLSLGIGSGDNPRTLDVDEGYIGETANYSPDQIFLATFAGKISTRDFVGDMDATTGFRPLDIGAVPLGSGLSNKRYLGLKYVDNSWSFLEVLARLPPFRIPTSDIRSRSTTLTVNDYQLRRPLDGKNNAGQEVDLEFTVETPRSVKVTLRGAYYWRGDAVKRFIHKDAWSASAGISLSL